MRPFLPLHATNPSAATMSVHALPRCPSRSVPCQSQAATQGSLAAVCEAATHCVSFSYRRRPPLVKPQTKDTGDVHDTLLTVPLVCEEVLFKVVVVLC